MDYQTMWLKGTHVVASKRLSSREEAERDAQQLLPFYQRRFHATRAEVWRGSQCVSMMDAAEGTRSQA